ncbi:hypothetical protein N0V86_007038 [Didymella sp. IMI 355093]|nr:hypothetical protein N0V86_007038 [Didymella sp. IMI 355093]
MIPSLLTKDQLSLQQYIRTIEAFGARCYVSGGVVWKDVLEEALYFDETVELNLDTDTYFPYGTASINWNLHEKFGFNCVKDSSFKLSTFTDGQWATFSDFDVLKRLLRKEMPTKDHKPMFTGYETVDIVLDSRLQVPVSLGDVCISIFLPLVSESSLLSGKQKITIRMWTPVDGVDAVIAEHPVTQQELRLKATTALESFIYSHSDGHSAQAHSLPTLKNRRSLRLHSHSSNR